jgi:DNA polymerase delta subunit 1
VVLAQRLARRDPASAPALGDRVPYVVVETLACDSSGGASGSSRHKVDLGDRVEDPVFALQHDLPIDVQWYIDHQLKKPLCALFEHVLPNPASMFSNVGMMAKAGANSADAVNAGVGVKQKSHAAVSGMMRGFVRATARCIGCGCVVISGESPAGHLCAHCLPQRAAIVRPKLERLAAVRADSARHWSQCATCVGVDAGAFTVTDLEDIGRDAAPTFSSSRLQMARLCRNMDCRTLFERHQSDRAMQRLEAELADL